LNINQDLLFRNLSQRLADKDNTIQKLKKLVEINNHELNLQNKVETANNPNNNKILKTNLNKKNNSNNNTRLRVSINKHQALNKKELINRKASLSNLFSWAKANKIKFNKVHINLNNHNSIINSEEKIQLGESLLSVPKEFILSVNNSRLKSICDTIIKIKELSDEYDLICLSVALKNELANNDELKEYINYLFDSVKFTNFPLFYNSAENQLIKGSYLNSLINARKSIYKFQYTILQKKNIFKSKNFSEEDYIKSRIILNSKFFFLNFNGKKTSALVPLADLFKSNKDNSNSELILLKNGSVELKAKKDIDKKENIHLSLGKFSNYHLLINHGFSILNNPVPIEVYLDLKIKNEKGEKKNLEILLTKDYNINNSISKLRKIVHKLKNEKNSKGKNFENPKTLENELESLSTFKIGLKSQIDNYSSNIKDDIIRSTNIKSSNEKNILNVLIEEKKVKNVFLKLIFFKH